MNDISYDEFVKSKRRAEVSTGHAPSELNEHLFDFQHAIVSWAVRRGRAAIFADTGLGKTLMQLSWADEVASRTGGMVLILAPLAVSEQTIEQGNTFGIEVKRISHGQIPDSQGIWITNYERMDAIDFNELHGIILDESSILKAHDGKTRTKIIEASQRVPYRLSCTATPSPNDFEELGNQCEFLGVMTRTEVCIWKDPVVAMQRTKALGLLHKTIRENSSMSRMGLPDYVVTMRKPGDCAERVTHGNDLPVMMWQKYASPIWDDINQGRTLNKLPARDENDEKHMCPLQLDVIERCIHLWTNPGDLVASPFTGIGSEGYCAVKMGRRFIGAELKPQYWELAVQNIQDAKQAKTADMFESEAA